MSFLKNRRVLNNFKNKIFLNSIGCVILLIKENMIFYDNEFKIFLFMFNVLPIVIIVIFQAPLI